MVANSMEIFISQGIQIQNKIPTVGEEAGQWGGGSVLWGRDEKERREKDAVARSDGFWRQRWVKRF